MSTDDNKPVESGTEHGDFAAGERTSIVDETGSDFASGERTSTVDETGTDYAAGERTQPKDPNAQPDFARGEDAAH
jgi:hypothetical protein